ncbi:MAG: MFS transporter [Nitrospinae bacterium CG11_big_fil_rev_8_21_14_0_20_56_8]|nr:MAG: MFS transporter [Nitrospinae bacterium CG11_big_fil_rev_8_21_14_0_20_56_8]
MTEKYPDRLKSELRRSTYRCDLWRGGCDGVLTTGAQTFCLFIAIRHFHASEWLKSAIAAGPFLGMFLSLLLVHYSSYTGMRKAAWGALPSALTAVCLAIAAWIPSAAGYTFFIVLGYTARSALLPFLTAIYHDNYPPGRRGSFFSYPLMLTVGISVVFGFIGSTLLERDIENFNWLFTFLGVCAAGKAWAIYKMPSQPVESGKHKNPFGNLRYAWEDRSFGYVLLTWFIMGFANLWTLPLRVDYITSADYGIEGSALFVTFIITILPDGMRFLFIPFWARLFDRIHFVFLRMVLNTLFALGVLLFFLTRNPVIIALGSALIGISFAGGSIAWSLWVTKYAPPGKIAAYMSVHVFLTGVRGTIGPLLGYWVAGALGIVNIGVLSFAMMILATLMLIPELRHKREEFIP